MLSFFAHIMDIIFSAAGCCDAAVSVVTCRIGGVASIVSPAFNFLCSISFALKLCNL